MQRNPVRDIPHYLSIFKSYLGARIYAVLALSMTAALAEGVGIIMVLPLLQGLDGRKVESTTAISQILNRLLEALGWEESTTYLLLLITAAFIVRGLLMFAIFGMIAFLNTQLLRKLKSKLFDDLTRMDFLYYASKDIGHFINVINTQIPRSMDAFRALVKLGVELVTTVVYMGLSFFVAWRFGLMALVFGVALLTLFRWLNVHVRQLSRNIAAENGRLANLVIQFLSAFKYLSATGQASTFRPSIMESINRITACEINLGLADGFIKALREPLGVIFIMLIILAQLLVFQDPLAPIMISVLLFYRGFNSIMRIQENWQNTLNYIGSLEIIRAEFDAQAQHRESDGSHLASPLSGGISLRNVHFSYDAVQGEVLKGVSLDIPALTSVALVGESGVGKSTVANLLTLILKPGRGQVLIDGVPGDRLRLSSWRKQIGYVSQETVIFDDTIANNICMWEGDTTRNGPLLERVREAARLAYLDHFLETMPDGYQTLVGDRGLRLSGGQRQRLFIARELFRKPKLLILDEATSALDGESEHYLQKSIEALKGRVTLVIIAHRLSTIRHVDNIYVFEQGQVVEQGPYDQLRDADNTRFGKLVALQTL